MGLHPAHAQVCPNERLACGLRACGSLWLLLACALQPACGFCVPAPCNQPVASTADPTALESAKRQQRCGVCMLRMGTHPSHDDHHRRRGAAAAAWLLSTPVPPPSCACCAGCCSAPGGMSTTARSGCEASCLHTGHAERLPSHASMHCMWNLRARARMDAYARWTHARERGLELEWWRSRVACIHAVACVGAAACIRACACAHTRLWVRLHARGGEDVQGGIQQRRV